jgi:DNA primase
MTMAFHDFKLLKQSVTIHQVLVHRGLDDRFKRRGDRLFGPCPVHGGDNPNAFVVSLSRDLWHCFSGCGRGGDVIDLVRSLDSLSFPQAGDYLASIASAPLPEPAPFPSPQSAPRSRPFKPFTRYLPLDPAADLLRQKGIRPSTASLFDTGAYHGLGFLQDCVGVRLHDPSGHPLGYAGRRLIPEHATLHGKWKLPPGLPKSSLLYGFHRLPARPTHICVAECPWSVMRLYQLDIPAVALLGSALSEPQRQLLEPSPRIVLVLDGDATGRSATRRIHDTLCHTNDVRVVTLPDGLDPDDLDDNQLASYLHPPLTL